MIKKLDGKIVTFAVRLFIPEGENANTGRIGFSSKGFYKKTPPITSVQGGWS